MVDLMERVGRQEDLTQLVATERAYPPIKRLIIASIVEREAQTDDDRYKIARVIYNRLALGMPLEVDATLFYGQDRRHRLDMLKATDSPYNTYLYPGLPPTPIVESRTGVDQS